MQLLYSNVLPLGVKDDQKIIIDVFNEQAAEADRVEIAVGYASNASLSELENLVETHEIKRICLTIGMYYIDGMPEGIYHTALRLNKKWQDSKVGEIRLVKPFKYHGKVFCFYRREDPISAIIGSANLGAIKLEAVNRRQYEISALTTDVDEVKEIAAHIEALKDPKCSVNIAAVSDIPLVKETNAALDGIQLVTPAPPSNVAFYRDCKAQISFFLPLKAPREAEKFLDDGKHFTKSNINVCYSAPRNKRKARDWYEAQLTVGANIYHMEGYPEKNKQFFVITDDGYWFKAHTTSANNKQFSAVGDELIMGRWIKGRLAAAKIATPINNVLDDTDRKGMITQEMLKEYGCNGLLFKKTGRTALDEHGEALDVWMLSFASDKEQNGV